MPCRFSQKPPSRTPYCYPQQAPEHHKKNYRPPRQHKKAQHKKNFAPTTKNRHKPIRHKKTRHKKMLQPTPQKTVTTRKAHRTTKTPQQHTPQTHTTNTALTVKATPRHPSRNTTTLSTRPARRRQAHSKQQQKGGTKHTRGQSQHTPIPQQNKHTTNP